MIYCFSPHTGEIINTDTPADWMGRTDLVPPVVSAAQSAVFRGGAWEVVEAVPVAELVPTTISMAQAQLVLLAGGHLDDVEAAVETMPREAQIVWRKANTVVRGDPLLIELAALLGLSEADVDALFVAGSKL
jgi:hypothetical protein